VSHVSAFALDALALGALDPEARAHALAHLDGCARCRADRDAADELRARFVAQVMPRTRPATRRRRWALLALPALAAAVALLVVWRDRGEPPELAIKGGATWQVFAHRADATFAVHDGTRLAAGDRIRFVISPAGARYVLVASIDGAGHATIYYPYAGPSSEPIAGPRAELPGSIVLDTAPGPERVFALLSDQPIAADPVIALLRTIGAAGPDAIRRFAALPIAARAQRSLVFEKAAP